MYLPLINRCYLLGQEIDHLTGLQPAVSYCQSWIVAHSVVCSVRHPPENDIDDSLLGVSMFVIHNYLDIQLSRLMKAIDQSLD
jgi:hypothetical protein